MWKITKDLINNSRNDDKINKIKQARGTFR